MGTQRRKVKRGKRARSKEERGPVKVARGATKTKSAGSTTPHGGVSTSEYEWHVTLAAKGMAERDNYPMPKSVTTPLAFYEIMAGAALDATGFRALLDRAARAERELDLLRDAIRLADDKAAMAGHRARVVPAGPTAAPVTTPPRAEPPPAAAPASPRDRRAARIARGGISGLRAVRATLVARTHASWAWIKRVPLRRPERVACTNCGARHPVLYCGDPCLICDTTLPSSPLSAREVRSPSLATA